MNVRRKFEHADRIWYDKNFLPEILPAEWPIFFLSYHFKFTENKHGF